MTREEAIIILKEEGWYMSRYSEEYKEAYDMAIEALQDDWIPVSERLPIEDGKYLAQYKTGSMDVLSWAGGWNCWRDIDGVVERNHEMKSVIAWRPLPAPYKESDSE